MTADIEQLRDGLKAGVESAITPFCRNLAGLGITPNQLTLSGLALGSIAAGLLAAGLPPWWAGLVFLAASLLDLLDGSLARSSGSSARLGAFLDSTCDRLQEGFLLSALIFRLALEGEALAAASAALALTGSLVTSYVRARAEALGCRCTSGWFCRPERVGLISLGLLSGLLAPMAHALALLSWMTVAQRVREVVRRLA